MSQWPNQQMALSANVAMQNTVHSLAAAAVKGKEGPIRTGRAPHPQGLGLKPQPEGAEAEKGALGTWHISSPQHSSTYSSCKPVILKQAPPAGEADANRSSIWIKMWLSPNCSPPYKKSPTFLPAFLGMMRKMSWECFSGRIRPASIV